jgi:hypothetical protein
MQITGSLGASVACGITFNMDAEDDRKMCGFNADESEDEESTTDLLTAACGADAGRSVAAYCSCCWAPSIHALTIERCCKSGCCCCEGAAESGREVWGVVVAVDKRARALCGIRDDGGWRALLSGVCAAGVEAALLSAEPTRVDAMDALRWLLRAARLPFAACCGCVVCATGRALDGRLCCANEPRSNASTALLRIVAAVWGRDCCGARADWEPLET